MLQGAEYSVFTVYRTIWFLERVHPVTFHKDTFQNADASQKKGRERHLISYVQRNYSRFPETENNSLSCPSASTDDTILHNSWLTHLAC